MSLTSPPETPKRNTNTTNTTSGKGHPLSDNDQARFLLACLEAIDPTPTIDFQKVADTCGIVSKAAAAKRYQRLRAASGGASSAKEKSDGAPVTPKKKREPSGSAEKSGKGKKVKHEGEDEGV